MHCVSLENLGLCSAQSLLSDPDMKSFSGSAAIALQLSLLASLGWLPVACGGNSESADPDAQAGTGGVSGAATITGGSGGRGGPATSSEGPLCTSPTFNEATGSTSCAENYSYRSKVVACAVRAGDPQAQAGAAGGSGVGGDAAAGGTRSVLGSFLLCGSDGSADCAAMHPHGFCKYSGPMFAPDVCSAGCSNDGECGSDELCSCGGDGAGVCMSSQCREESDCSPGFHCRMFGPAACTSGGSFACQSANDECLTREDCPLAVGSHSSSCLFEGREASDVTEQDRRFLLLTAQGGEHRGHGLGARRRVPARNARKHRVPSHGE